MNTANVASLGQALFEDARDAMFLLDPVSNCLIDANRMAERITCLSRVELRGMAFAHLIDYPQPDQWQALQIALKKAANFTAREGYRLRTAQPGTYVPVALTASRLRARPRPLILIVARDLRKQREAFERLGQVEEQLQRVLALVSDAVWSATCDADEHWVINYTSPALARIAGQPSGTFATKPESWWEVIHPDDRARARSEYRRLRECDPPAVADVEYRIVWPDGTIRWARDRVRYSRDPHSQLPRLDGVLSDVTERRQSEERLNFQAQVLAQLSDAVVAVDNDSRVTYWNRSAEQLYGVPATQALGQPLAQAYRVGWLRPEDEATALAALYREGAWTGELLHVCWDGMTVPVECRVCVLRDEAGQAVGMLSVNRNVRARHRAEAAVRASEARHRALLSAIPDLLFHQDRRGVYLDCHANSGARLPAPPQQIVGRPMDEVWPPEILAALGPAFQAVVATGQPQQCEYPDTRDGEARRYEARLVAVSDDAGRAAGVLTLVRDITVRHRAEDALAQSEERFRSLFERHGSVMLVLDAAADRIIDANPAAEQFYGLGRDELRRLSVTALNPFAPEQIRAALARADQGRQHLFVMEHRLASGDQRLVEVYASPIDDADGRPLLFAIIHDLTERRRLEDRLRQVQKLEAIGRLAGGIAHDFNNLMTAVTGYSSLLLAKLPADHVLREYADEIRKAGERAAGLTRQLLAFSRQSPVRPTVLDLNQVARGMLKMLGRLVGDGARLTADLPDGLWAVKADLGQTEQVLMNLVTNARDALPPVGGSIAIATANVALSDDMVPTRPEVQPGPYVRLTVRDTGSGMDRETLARIFEPFFTTKPVGQGTGLGLASVYGIVQQAGGYVYADSAIGQGTTLTIFLPRAVEPVSPPAPPPSTVLPRGTETVLLAEDEDGVRALVGTILTACGYTVLRAADGRHGLAVAAAHPGAIDLVVSDVVMPGLGGPQMVAELRRQRPGLNAMYISGHVGPRGDDGPLGTNGGRLLLKPFTPAALAQAVRDVLDGLAN